MGLTLRLLPSIDTSFISSTTRISKAGEAITNIICRCSQFLSLWNSKPRAQMAFKIQWPLNGATFFATNHGIDFSNHTDFRHFLRLFEAFHWTQMALKLHLLFYHIQESRNWLSHRWKDMEEGFERRYFQLFSLWNCRLQCAAKYPFYIGLLHTWIVVKSN